MAYDPNPASYIDRQKQPKMPSVPKWLLDKIPKGKSCNIKYCDGAWFIDGKPIYEPNCRR